MEAKAVLPPPREVSARFFVDARRAPGLRPFVGDLAGLLKELLLNENEGKWPHTRYNVYLGKRPSDGMCAFLVQDEDDSVPAAWADSLCELVSSEDPVFPMAPHTTVFLLGKQPSMLERFPHMEPPSGESDVFNWFGLIDITQVQNKHLHAWELCQDSNTAVRLAFTRRGLANMNMQAFESTYLADSFADDLFCDKRVIAMPLPMTVMPFGRYAEWTFLEEAESVKYQTRKNLQLLTDHMDGDRTHTTLCVVSALDGCEIFEPQIVIDDSDEESEGTVSVASQPLNIQQEQFAGVAQKIQTLVQARLDAKRIPVHFCVMPHCKGSESSDLRSRRHTRLVLVRMGRIHTDSMLRAQAIRDTCVTVYECIKRAIRYRRQASHIVPVTICLVHTHAPRSEEDAKRAAFMTGVIEHLCYESRMMFLHTYAYPVSKRALDSDWFDASDLANRIGWYGRVVRYDVTRPLFDPHPNPSLGPPMGLREVHVDLMSISLIYQNEQLSRVRQNASTGMAVIARGILARCSRSLHFQNVQLYAHGMSGFPHTDEVLGTDKHLRTFAPDGKEVFAPPMSEDTVDENGRFVVQIWKITWDRARFDREFDPFNNDKDRDAAQFACVMASEWLRYHPNTLIVFYLLEPSQNDEQMCKRSYQNLDLYMRDVDQSPCAVLMDRLVFSFIIGEGRATESRKCRAISQRLRDMIVFRDCVS